MKVPVLIWIFALLEWSVTSLKGEEPPTEPMIASREFPASLQSQIESSGDAFRSVILKHIANFTALVAEEYLRDLAAATPGILRENVSGLASEAQRPVVADEKLVRVSNNGRAKDIEDDLNQKPLPGHNDGLFSAASKPRHDLLPPSWSLSGDVPLVAGCSPACNCDSNPTSVCCLKVCGRTFDQPIPATNQSQDAIPGVNTQAGPNEDPQAPIPASCPCNCGNPTTTCCLKICGRRLKAGLDRHTTSSLARGVEIDEAQRTSSDSTISIDAALARLVDVPTVKLGTSTGELLSIMAHSDFDVYASFISVGLAEELGMTARINKFTSRGKWEVAVNGQDCLIVGTVTIHVEGYTRRKLDFQDVFYVFEVEDGAGTATKRLDLVFGVEALRQAKVLALEPGLFE